METLEEIIDIFQSVDAHTRLEVLMEFADRLPPLPPMYLPIRDAGLHMVHECQSPVFLFVEVKGTIVQVCADVSREAPVARGFTALLTHLFNGAEIRTIHDAPDNLLAALNLENALGMQRRRGLAAIYRRVKSVSA